MSAGLLVACIAACASGGRDDSGDDDPMTKVDASVSQQRDANTSVVIDAPLVTLDAGLPLVDASGPAQPDAATGPFCSQNSQCTKQGECCITLSGPMGFCGPGTVVLGQCVPK